MRYSESTRTNGYKVRVKKECDKFGMLGLLNDYFISNIIHEDMESAQAEIDKNMMLFNPDSLEIVKVGEWAK
ncbi:MAG: hypothetical protein IKW18_06265 [Clostridia bacterium]|nr:hypothetical protein [Clostridia bacterium]